MSNVACNLYLTIQWHGQLEVHMTIERHFSPYLGEILSSLDGNVIGDKDRLFDIKFHADV